ncbi:phosphatidate cytidylyltransferase [Paenibacillus massiliensis]|uniref:phosphatidate cytidylyltransferase n=1 Tax=Paenibacillus massiliensis TaxID=225917 RepID=UPI00035D3790|nr:phosphatidate cytidylyltransferase [Paenibacillus massiliensis]
MKQRLLTGIIAGALFFMMVYLGGLPYHILILAMALIGIHEFIRMIKVSSFSIEALLSYVGVLLLVFPYEPLHVQPPLELSSMLWIWLTLFLVVTVLSKNRVNINTAALLFLGTVYVGVGFSAIADSRHMAYGLFWTILLLASIWSSDAGAYFAGKAFGRTKLWPSISPNKTIEGSVGGIILAVVVAVVFSWFSGGLLTVGHAIVIGLACSLVGQLGDLIQSAYKRSYDIKDSGRLLPGHGGILDRCDSWIVVFPFIHMFLLPF